MIHVLEVRYGRRFASVRDVAQERRRAYVPYDPDPDRAVPYAQLREAAAGKAVAQLLQQLRCSDPQAPHRLREVISDPERACELWVVECEGREVDDDP